MPRYRVEVWEVQSYFIAVEAEHLQAAEDEVQRIVQDMSPEAYGCEYGDKWLDVMEAEVKT